MAAALSTSSIDKDKVQHCQEYDVKETFSVASAPTRDRADEREFKFLQERLTSASHLARWSEKEHFLRIHVLCFQVKTHLPVPR